jgi:hypothetical protein
MRTFRPKEFSTTLGFFSARRFRGRSPPLTLRLRHSRIAASLLEMIMADSNVLIVGAAGV